MLSHIRRLLDACPHGAQIGSQRWPANDALPAISRIEDEIFVQACVAMTQPTGSRGMLRFGQAAPKIAGSENRGGAYFKFVSTGSAGIRHLQAGIT
jgi:hypothetical protein